MPDFAHLAVRQQHFNDVEADFYLRILEQFQIIERTLRNESAFADIHSGGRAGPFFGRTRLYLDKHETVPVAEDEIDFATVGAEICGEEFESELLEMCLGCTLTQCASLKVRRKIFRIEQSFGPAP